MQFRGSWNSSFGHRVPEQDLEKQVNLMKRKEGSHSGQIGNLHAEKQT